MRKVALAIAVAAMLVGCSSGSDDAATTTVAPISKTEFIAQADAICKAGNDKISADTTGVDTSDEDAVASAVRDKIVPNIRQQIADIRDLGFPKGDEDELDSIFDATEQVLQHAEDDPSIFVGSEDPFADVNADLAAYGFNECGNA